MTTKRRNIVFSAARALVLALVIGKLAACSNYYGGNAASRAIYSTQQESVDLRAEVETACAQLIRAAKHTNKRNDTLLIVSFADLSALDQSSRLGRLMGQDCSTEFVSHGYQVTEPLFADALYIDPSHGELMLSRNLEVLVQDHQATAVVVGTYTLGRDTVYANARMIRSRDALVLSAVSFEIPLTREVSQLIAQGPR
ncbi:FlgO family outer membrane protein [Luminiphilus sp. nBUS_07]|uniref:FlgO family outer membrane protein n=1 Tax=Luminiphilus sp. nBUS_07 TaxID=3395314 RepID=UPI003EB7B28F